MALHPDGTPWTGQELAELIVKHRDHFLKKKEVSLEEIQEIFSKFYCSKEIIRKDQAKKWLARNLKQWWIIT